MPEHNLQQTIALLSRTPAAVNALLRDLPEDWTARNEGDGTWTAFDIVGHLKHCERVDWMVRVKSILQPGGTWPFKPVDREAQKSEKGVESLAQALDDFARLRAANLAELQGFDLQDEDMERRGLHPAFGPVTLSQLLATWATHDLTHLHQLSRVMAHQYRDAVGPWIAYLGVLHCDGHSAP